MIGRVPPTEAALPFSVPQRNAPAKFLGWFTAASTSCCGCTLQSGVYVLALLSLVVGTLMSVGVLTQARDTSFIFSLIGTGASVCIICFGIVAWKAAADFRLDFAQLSIWLMFGSIVFLALQQVLEFIATFSPAFSRLIVEEVAEEFARIKKEPLTDEEMHRVIAEADVIVMVVRGISLLIFFLMSSMGIYFEFILWSFKTRLQAGEFFLLTTGIPHLPSDINLRPLQAPMLTTTSPSTHTGGPPVEIPTQNPASPPAVHPTQTPVILSWQQAAAPSSQPDTPPSSHHHPPREPPSENLHLQMSTFSPSPTKPDDDVPCEP